MTADLGHDGGPSLEGGVSWRLPCWSSARGRVRAPGKLSSDQVILVRDLGLARDWCAPGRRAGYLPARRCVG